MIDTRQETIIPIGDVPSHVPGRPHLATIYRWLQRGSAGQRLESIRVGGRRFTSVEAVHRFIGRVTDAVADSRDEPTGETSLHASAEVEADAFGL